MLKFLFNNMLLTVGVTSGAA